MLTMLEEVVLLAVDEQSGRLHRRRSGRNTRWWALFFDLALAKRIDTDTEEIRVTDPRRPAIRPWTGS
jgi:hypothetical protein